MKLLLLAIAFLLAGCSQETPDRREATLVVEDAAMRDVVAAAVDWWAEATDGDVNLVLADRCDDKDDSAPRSCFTLKDAERDALPGYGRTTPWYKEGGGANGARILIRRDLQSFPFEFQQIVVAHEIGHALMLHHVEGRDEIMRDGGGELTACIGPKTGAEYTARYGTPVRTVCR